MNLCIKNFVLCILILLVTACSSLPPEKGPSMDDIFNSGPDGRTSNNSLNALKKSMILDYTQIGDEPVKPLTMAPMVMPIWLPSSDLSPNIRKGGQWIYEIMHEGGFVPQ